MTEPVPSDVAFARFVVRHAFVAEGQVESARALQADRAQQGGALSLPDALVQIGALAPAQRDDILQRLTDRHLDETRQLKHYRIERRLGEGGMGTVYLAVDTRENRRVALKVLPPHLAADDEFMTRFHAETLAMLRLRHENIVGAYAAGKDDGRHFIAMEYCEGETLDRRLEREGCLPSGEAVRIVTQVARGLKHAHEAGFVHRDIKPANIMVVANGVAKILDLGLSKRIGPAAAAAAGGDTTIGTPDYIAPEHARAEPDVDGRADIYSLGATFYHLVAGRAPFQGTSVVDVLAKHFHEPVPDPRTIRMDIPMGVVPIIHRMMEKRREDRYPDCGALLKDLAWVLKA
jgi:serine/threonine-protein kinase